MTHTLMDCWLCMILCVRADRVNQFPRGEKDANASYSRYHASQLILFAGLLRYWYRPMSWTGNVFTAGDRIRATLLLCSAGSSSEWLSIYTDAYPCLKTLADCLIYDPDGQGHALDGKLPFFCDQIHESLAIRLKPAIPVHVPGFVDLLPAPHLDKIKVWWIILHRLSFYPLMSPLSHPNIGLFPDAIPSLGASSVTRRNHGSTHLQASCNRKITLITTYRH